MPLLYYTNGLYRWSDQLINRLIPEVAKHLDAVARDLAPNDTSNWTKMHKIIHALLGYPKTNVTTCADTWLQDSKYSLTMLDQWAKGDASSFNVIIDLDPPALAVRSLLTHAKSLYLKDQPFPNLEALQVSLSHCFQRMIPSLKDLAIDTLIQHPNLYQKPPYSNETIGRNTKASLRRISTNYRDKLAHRNRITRDAADLFLARHPMSSL